MHRSGDFESAGKGCYRLSDVEKQLAREANATDYGTAGDDIDMSIVPVGFVTQKDVAQGVLRAKGRSAKVAEIMREALRRIWLRPREKNAASSIRSRA